MRKALCYIILLSMTLHCASRLGVISYLYKQRNELAYTIGLISEIPIALCNSDYDFDKGITVVTQTAADHTLPSALFAAPEINLFVQDHPFVWTPLFGTVSQRWASYSFCHNYPAPAGNIFRPPVLA